MEIGDDIIDTREVKDRLLELEDQIDEDAAENPDKPETAGLTDDEVEELEMLRAFYSELEDTFVDTTHGVALVEDSYFQTYAEQLAEDLGLVDDSARWPATCIDWKEAAEELQTDYTSVEVNGYTYWGR